MDSDETWQTRLVCDKEELIRFYWSSANVSRFENFSSDSSPLRDRAKNDMLHNISKGYGWIPQKLCGQVVCVCVCVKRIN